MGISAEICRMPCLPVTPAFLWLPVIWIEDTILLDLTFGLSSTIFAILTSSDFLDGWGSLMPFLPGDARIWIWVLWCIVSALLWNYAFSHYFLPGPLPIPECSTVHLSLGVASLRMSWKWWVEKKGAILHLLTPRVFCDAYSDSHMVT